MSLLACSGVRHVALQQHHVHQRLSLQPLTTATSTLQVFVLMLLLLMMKHVLCTQGLHRLWHRQLLQDRS
jgi:hypothetical protein